ncbi:3-deoxy-D-manno-octulosonate 8-phosphate phosphatase KdsC OS=Streptomyces fumanus OX=67302 GN=GCM10018772_42640 PE=3 SV=1 [Streptomyces fumanus]
MTHPEAGRGATKRRVLAVIPARGGSKGVPAKNLAPVGGVPLVARAVRECRAARLVTDVVVSTDDQAIAAAARQAGAEVVLRPAAIAGDTATSEAAVLHALDAHEALHGTPVDVVLLVQCTSPFLIREDIDAVAAAVAEQGADTAVTVAPFHGFLWRDGDDPAEGGYGVNHDKSYRPRRQDRPQDLLETGAAYAMAAPGFREHRHRFFGRTEPVRTDPARVLEIDDPHDLARPARSPRCSTPTGLGALPTADDIDAVVLDFRRHPDRRPGADRLRRTGVRRRAPRRRPGHRRPAPLGTAHADPVHRAEPGRRRPRPQAPPAGAARRRPQGPRPQAVVRGPGHRPRARALRRQRRQRPSVLRPRRLAVAVAGAHDVVRGAARAVTTVPGGDGAIVEIAGWISDPRSTLSPPSPSKDPSCHEHQLPPARPRFQDRRPRSARLHHRRDRHQPQRRAGERLQADRRGRRRARSATLDEVPEAHPGDLHPARPMGH